MIIWPCVQQTGMPMDHYHISHLPSNRRRVFSLRERTMNVYKATLRCTDEAIHPTYGQPESWPNIHPMLRERLDIPPLLETYLRLGPSVINRNKKLLPALRGPLVSAALVRRDKELRYKIKTGSQVKRSEHQRATLISPTSSQDKMGLDGKKHALESVTEMGTTNLSRASTLTPIIKAFPVITSKEPTEHDSLINDTNIPLPTEPTLTSPSSLTVEKHENDQLDKMKWRHWVLDPKQLKQVEDDQKRFALLQQDTLQSQQTAKEKAKTAKEKAKTAKEKAKTAKEKAKTAKEKAKTASLGALAAATPRHLGIKSTKLTPITPEPLIRRETKIAKQSQKDITPIKEKKASEGFVSFKPETSIPTTLEKENLLNVKLLHKILEKLEILERELEENKNLQQEKTADLERQDTSSLILTADSIEDSKQRELSSMKTNVDLKLPKTFSQSDLMRIDSTPVRKASIIRLESIPETVDIIEPLWTEQVSSSQLGFEDSEETKKKKEEETKEEVGEDEEKMIYEPITESIESFSKKVDEIICHPQKLETKEPLEIKRVPTAPFIDEISRESLIRKLSTKASTVEDTCLMTSPVASPKKSLKRMPLSLKRAETKQEEKPKENSLSSECFYLTDDGKTWVDSILENNPYLGITILSPDKTKSDKFVDLSSTTHSEWIDARTVKIDVEDIPDPVVVRFKDEENANIMKSYLNAHKSALKLAEGEPDALEISSDSENDLALHILNNKTNVSETTTLPTPDDKQAAKRLLNQLKTKELKKLPSFSSDFIQRVEEMMDFLNNTVPEARLLLHDTSCAIFRHGEKTSDSIKMKLYCNYGVAMGVFPSTQRVPESVQTVRNFHPSTTLLDLGGMQRNVPMDGKTYLLTLKCDEPRRLHVDSFPTVIERRAFGDLGDSLSYFSFISDYSASITLREKKLGELVKDRMEKIDGLGIQVTHTNENSLLSAYSDVYFDNGIPHWKSVTGLKIPVATIQTLETWGIVESYTRPTATTVVVNFKNKTPSLTFKIPNTKLQQLFGEYIKHILLRERFEEKLVGTPLTRHQETEKNELKQLLMRLLEECPNEWGVLARLPILIRGGKIGKAYLPGHFNMISTRLVPNRDTIANSHSIDLRNVIGFGAHPYFTAKLTFKNEEEGETIYDVQFKRLTDLYALQTMCTAILRYYSRENVEEAPVISGVAYAKAGARVAKTRQQLLRDKLLKSPKEKKEPKGLLSPKRFSPRTSSGVQPTSPDAVVSKRLLEASEKQRMKSDTPSPTKVAKQNSPQPQYKGAVPSIKKAIPLKNTYQKKSN